MSADDNKAVLLHLAEAFNKGSLAIIDDVFSPTFTCTMPIIRIGRAGSKAHEKCSR